ncbi:hypothetical protein SODG_006919 [Sodalis praecaptivus]|nr:hypothetical protein NVIRENTERO_02778 [Sodalis praecaptivus]
MKERVSHGSTRAQDRRLMLANRAVDQPSNDYLASLRRDKRISGPLSRFTRQGKRGDEASAMPSR